MDNIENEVKDVVDYLAQAICLNVITWRAAQQCCLPTIYAKVCEQIEEWRQTAVILEWQPGMMENREVAFDLNANGKIPEEPCAAETKEPLLKLGPGGDFVREILGEEIQIQVDTEDINAQVQGADIEPAAWVR